MKKIFTAVFEVESDEEVENIKAALLNLSIKRKQAPAMTTCEDILDELKLSKIYTGYNYIVQTVDIIIRNDYKNIGVALQEVAKNNNTTRGAVERALRYAIKKVMENNLFAKINKLLGVNYDSYTEKLFIMTLANRLK